MFHSSEYASPKSCAHGRKQQCAMDGGEFQCTSKIQRVPRRGGGGARCASRARRALAHRAHQRTGRAWPPQKKPMRISCRRLAMHSLRSRGPRSSRRGGGRGGRGGGRGGGGRAPRAARRWWAAGSRAARSSARARSREAKILGRRSCVPQPAVESKLKLWNPPPQKKFLSSPPFQSFSTGRV